MQETSKEDRPHQMHLECGVGTLIHLPNQSQTLGRCASGRSEPAWFVRRVIEARLIFLRQGVGMSRTFKFMDIENTHNDTYLSKRFRARQCPLRLYRSLK